MKEVLRSQWWLAGIAVLILAAQGCAVTPKDVYDAAKADKAPETAVEWSNQLQRQAGALYLVYETYVKQAALLAEDERTPQKVKVLLYEVVEAASPPVEAMVDGMAVAATVIKDLEAGDSTVENLTVINSRLTDWINAATPVVNKLVAYVKQFTH